MDEKAVGPAKKQLPKIQAVIVNGCACSDLPWQALTSDQIVIPSYCGVEWLKAFGFLTL